MSMVAIPFAVDIQKVYKIFGCKDSALLENIKTANLYNHYADQDHDFADKSYEYSLDSCLEDLIFNYIKPEERQSKKSFFGLIKSKVDTGLNVNIAHGYGYALLVICDYFGTHLLPECDGFYWGKDFKAAQSIMQKYGLNMDVSDMFESHQVFDIPKIADFPGIKLFTKQEINHISEVMDKIEIDETKTDFSADDYDEVQEMLYYIKRCFKTCEELNLDFITFTH